MAERPRARGARWRWRGNLEEVRVALLGPVRARAPARLTPARGAAGGDPAIAAPPLRGEGIAFKTGTSCGHRNALALGWDGAYVVGVWMGRADGRPVPGAFGADLAAPVLFAAFERLGPVTALPPPPPATLIVAGDALPEALRRFRGDGQGPGGPVIAFPPEGARVEGRALVARVAEGAPPFAWLADGVPLGTTRGREMALDPGPGFSRVTVVDAEGRSASSAFELTPPG